jgi:hypothetical protein
MSELYLACNNNINPKYLVIAPNNFDNDIRVCNIVYYYTIIEIPNIPNYYYFISFTIFMCIFTTLMLTIVVITHNNKL